MVLDHVDLVPTSYGGASDALSARSGVRHRGLDAAIWLLAVLYG